MHTGVCGDRLAASQQFGSKVQARSIVGGCTEGRLAAAAIPAHRRPGVPAHGRMGRQGQGSGGVHP